MTEYSFVSKTVKDTVARTRRYESATSIGNIDVADLGEMGSTIESLRTIKNEIQAKLTELDAVFNNHSNMTPDTIASVVAGFEDTMASATAASVILQKKAVSEKDLSGAKSAISLRTVAEATVNLVKPSIRNITNNLRTKMGDKMADALFTMD